MTKIAPQCFSCLKFLKTGVSLDGSGTPHVCMSCWKSMPAYRRIQLMLVSRPKEHGGLGLRSTIEAVLNPMTWARRN